MHADLKKIPKPILCVMLILCLPGWLLYSFGQAFEEIGGEILRRSEGRGR